MVHGSMVSWFDHSHSCLKFQPIKVGAVRLFPHSPLVFEIIFFRAIQRNEILPIPREIAPSIHRYLISLGGISRRLLFIQDYTNGVKATACKSPRLSPLPICEVATLLFATPIDNRPFPLLPLSLSLLLLLLRYRVLTWNRKKSPARQRGGGNRDGDRWSATITSLEGPVRGRNDLRGSCSCREINETAASRRRSKISPPPPPSSPLPRRALPQGAFNVRARDRARGNK